MGGLAWGASPPGLVPRGEAKLDSRAESLGISSRAPSCGTGLGNTAQHLLGALAERARRLITYQLNAATPHDRCPRVLDPIAA